ncbi:MAG: hypothetical protein ACRDNZ_04225 [Streptosporangiaceae bacterium]
MKPGGRKHRDVSTAAQLRRAREPQPVTVTRLLAEGLEVAREIAGGDLDRIVATGGAEATIYNTPEQASKARRRQD